MRENVDKLIVLGVLCILFVLLIVFRKDHDLSLYIEGGATNVLGGLLVMMRGSHANTQNVVNSSVSQDVSETRPST